MPDAAARERTAWSDCALGTGTPCQTDGWVEIVDQRHGAADVIGIAVRQEKRPRAKRRREPRARARRRVSLMSKPPPPNGLPPVSNHQTSCRPALQHHRVALPDIEHRQPQARSIVAKHEHP